MEPGNFHNTARLLSDREEEENIRTSINRSYYGLFLYLRDFLTSNGIKMPDRNSRNSHHKFVLQCIHEAIFYIKRGVRDKDPDISGIYSRLRALLQHRTDADYNLRVRFFPNDSKDNLRLATTTIVDFNGLDAERKQRIVDSAKIQPE